MRKTEIELMIEELQALLQYEEVLQTANLGFPVYSCVSRVKETS